MPAEARLLDTRVMEHLAERLAAIPGVVAVTLGGSRATGTAAEGSDWDFGLYYRDGLDPADITALGWPGQVFAPGEWGTIVNGGAWLTVDGAKVDLIYRDLDEVLRWTAAAGDGRFEIRREVGYVAGIATYILAGELALGRVLAGDLPRPAFPPRLRATAPEAWFRLAAGALSFAGVYAGRRGPPEHLVQVPVDQVHPGPADRQPRPAVDDAAPLARREDPPRPAQRADVRRVEAAP
ncbi:MAG TPA: nucleotidyltransferase domain-containing protein, partial [Streptosporangiaceae bacterium]|nr:nucleotidyltransferase domain-containing protein [Streptosporangiaceae bacterium]